MMSAVVPLHRLALPLPSRRVFQVAVVGEGELVACCEVDAELRGDEYFPTRDVRATAERDATVDEVWIDYAVWRWHHVGLERPPNADHSRAARAAEAGARVKLRESWPLLILLWPLVLLVAVMQGCLVLVAL
jgi:hypothetical protein